MAFKEALYVPQNMVVLLCGAVDEGVLDFDSDGRTRDIGAPIVIQGTGRVSDSKVSVRDLRLWPELVEAFGGLGLAIEIRRIGR